MHAIATSHGLGARRLQPLSPRRNSFRWSDFARGRAHRGDRHVACSLDSRAAMSLEETFSNLSAFLNSLDAEGEQKFELSHSLVIICPDCGKNIAFRGRCPKCGGNSWIPAGHAGGV